MRLSPPATAALESGTEPDARSMRMVDLMRETYRGTLMIAGGFDRDSAEAWLEQGKADLIAFGRKFLANPDLPERFRLRAPLNPATRPPTTAATPSDTPTIRPLPRSATSSRGHGWTKDGASPARARDRTQSDLNRKCALP